MSRNPFSHHRPINNPDRFIGREDELSDILACLDKESFGSTSIVGERRIGRTSLLKVLPSKLKDAHFIYMDLQMMKSKDTPTDFWKQVLHKLPHPLLNDDLKARLSELYQVESYNSFVLDGFFEALGGAGLSVVLLLDELERLADNPNFDPDFFYELRALALNHRLALVTTSQTELAKLSLSDRNSGASPFFNIFDILHLGSFKLNEVHDFFDHYLAEISFPAGAKIHFTSEDRDFLISIAGRHPYYLAIGGRLLFDAHLNLSPEERLKNVKLRFTDQVRETLRYSWSHTDKVERFYLTMLALLALKESAAYFSKKRLTNYYYTTDQTVERLINRGLLIEQKESVAIFSIVFAEWIRDELRERRPSQKAYNAWLNDSETQGSLKYLKKTVLSEVTESVLPVIKPKFRDWVISWLLNAGDVKGVVALLQVLHSKGMITEGSDSTVLAESVLKPLIYTEGKTDWKHLKAAWQKLKAAGYYSYLEIEFEEYEEEIKMGSAELKNLCQHSS